VNTSLLKLIIIHRPTDLKQSGCKIKNFEELVEKAWEDTDLVAGSDRMLAKLGHMHTILHDWDKKFLKLPKKCIKKAQ
jgi:hypothetical protein